MSESTSLYPPKPHIVERAHIGSMEEYERLYRLSLDNPDWFWAEQAKDIDWFHSWENVFDADYDEVDFAWFSGGRLNAWPRGSGSVTSFLKPCMKGRL